MMEDYGIGVDIQDQRRESRAGSAKA